MLCKGPNLTFRKAIPLCSSPRPHLPGDSFLEAATAVGAAAAMWKLEGAAVQILEGPRAASTFLPEGGFLGH